MRRLGKTPYVILGALASGLGNYLFQVVATRALGDEAFAPLGVLWTIWYLLLTIFLFSVEAWVTRRRALGRLGDGLRPLAGWIVAFASALGAVTWLFAGALFAGLRPLAGIAALLVLSYGAFAVLRGELAGSDRFRPYAALTALESLAKVALVIPVALLVPSTTALALLLPAGPVVAMGWWWMRHRRAPARRPVGAAPAAAAAPGPVGARDTRAGRFLLVTAVPGAAAQVLLAAGPLVLVALAASASEVSVFFVTITAARVPIVLAFGGLLSLMLPPLVRMARAGEVRALRRIGVATTGASVLLGGLGALVGARIGPPLVALLFGAAFEPPAWLAAITAYGVIVASGAMGLNQVLIAQERELALMPSWGLALAAAGAAISALSGSPSWRVAVGFGLGVTVALLGLALTVIRTTSDAGARRAGGGRSPGAGGAARS